MILQLSKILQFIPSKIIRHDPYKIHLCILCSNNDIYTELLCWDQNYFVEFIDGNINCFFWIDCSYECSVVIEWINDGIINTCPVVHSCEK